MKKFTLIFIALTFSIKLFADSFTWTGNSNSNWNDEFNFINDGLGMPNGVPNTGDFVTFNNSNNANCTLDIDVELAGIDIDGYTGTIDINGHSFQITADDATFNTGTITGGTLTINTTGTVRFAGTTFGAIVNSVSERVFLNGSTFNAVTTIEKNGASNDDSNGGNTFAENTTITNSGTARIILGNSNPDDFQADLTFINSGSSYSRLANNSAGNTVSGNLTVTNSGNSDTYIQINYNSASTLNITGNATLNNMGTGSQSRIIFDRDGSVSIGGDLSINNNSAATTARMYIANRTTSQLTIAGTTTVINDGTTTNNQIYLGNNGDITFNGTLDITNNSSATNSRIYCNYDDNSTNTYNENITVESTNASSDGISFGESNGDATLAATKTITIGGSGFIAGYLYFRNFTQTGNTAQTLTCTGTAGIYNYDCSWGGDVAFTSPRMYTRGTTYNETAYLEKTGAGDDNCAGGNTFVKNTTLKNSGSRYFYMGNGNPDVFQADLLMENTGSYVLYLAYNSAGNTIAGDLTLNNSANGNNTYIAVGGYAVSTVDVTGNVVLNNTGAGTTSQIYLCSRGNINIGGNLDITNNPTSTTGQILVANNDNASITITGNTTISNNGSSTTDRIYVGNQGDITFNGTLDITNNSSATNSEVYCNYNDNSSNTYNENITVESTDASCDGVRFGESNGVGVLAATKTITIGGAGFIAGDLEFRNFTQTGNTAHTLTCTGTARIYNYDSNWGGDVVFTAPRINTRGTTYSGTAYLEKTGAGDDNCAGGNTFTGNTTLKNSGSRYFLMGNGSPDDFQGNLEMYNTGSHNMYIAYNSAGNTIAGNLTLSSTTSGTNTYIYFSSNAASTLSIAGTTTITNTSTANNGIVYFPDNGTLNCGGDVNITNNCSGTTGTIYFGDNGAVTCNSDVSITNNCSGTNANVYVGNVSDVNISGNLDLVNSSSSTNSYIYIASNENSTVQIDGNTTISNSGAATTKRVYVGNQGDITFNGTLTLSNSSSAANSQIYCNYNDNSNNSYNENITVECTDASCDGILFGNSNGSGTLAATKTITISAGGFIAGDLEFRNFTQVGNTAHNLTATGTARIYNYDSNWGGDIRFIAPRNLTRGTTYNRTAYLEKTGASNDESAGGNTFAMDVDFVNSGSGYFMLGNGTFDNYQANVSLLNSGTSTMYFARNGAGHSVAGNLDITNSASGTNTYIYVGDNNSVTLNIGGTTSLLNNSSSDNGRIYFGNRGDITCNNNVTATNNASGTASYLYIGNVANITINGNLDITNSLSNTTSNVYVASNSASTVQISGATTVSNSGTGTTAQTFLGNQGDITFSGTLAIENSSSATNSQVYCNYDDNSNNTYNENITVECTDANCDGILFGYSNGSGTLAATKTITISGGGFIAGYLYFRNFTQTGATAQTLQPTSTAYFYNYNSNWGGDVIFTAPRMYTRGTTYNGTAFLEKTGALDDMSYGGNTFVGNTTLKNSGSRYFGMGNGSPDNFQADLLVDNVGGHNMYLAHNSAGNTIAGDLTINNSGSANNTYVYISTNNASTLSIGGNCLILNNGTSDRCYTYFGNSGDITLSGNLSINNNSTATYALLDIAQNTNSQVIINGNTTISNNGTGTTDQIFVGYNGDITFNGTLDITNNSSATNSQIYLNHDDNSSNTYNENITVESTDASCDGILFGNSNGSGTLADTKTVTIGGGGFIAGYLQFRNFTQTGATAQTLHPTGTSIFYNYNSEWNGNVNFVSPRHYTRGTTYNGTAYLEKNGASNDASNGGNTFNAEATLVSNGTGYFMPANGTANDFNADVNYIKSNTGPLYPTYNCASTYAGNINIDFNAQVYFGAAGHGRVIMDGTNAQSINDIGTSTLPLFRDFQTNNPNSEITLNTPIEIVTELDLDSGNIITNTTNLLTMRDNSTVSSVSNDAYIDGPIEKIGNDAFTFPVGNDGYYAAISMSAPNNASRRFRAQYFHQDADNAGDRTALEATLNHISYKEYWTLDRTSGASNVTVTLSWENARSGDVDNLTTLRVAHWDGTLWTDEGNGSTTGDLTAGTVVTSAAVTSFSPFTLASTREENPLPITLLSFTGEKLDKSTLLSWKTQTEINNDYFILEKSADGINYNEIANIEGSENSNSILYYNFEDVNPYNGINYYRLTQVDFDGKFEIFKPISIYFDNIINTKNINLYPNPVNNSNYLTISYDEFNENSTIEVVDIKGRTIKVNYTVNLNSIIINTSNLDKGAYFAVFYANNEINKKMFIVN